MCAKSSGVRPYSSATSASRSSRAARRSAGSTSGRWSGSGKSSPIAFRRSTRSGRSPVRCLVTSRDGQCFEVEPVEVRGDLHPNDVVDDQMRESRSAPAASGHPRPSTRRRGVAVDGWGHQPHDVGPLISGTRHISHAEPWHLPRPASTSAMAVALLTNSLTPLVVWVVQPEGLTLVERQVADTRNRARTRGSRNRRPRRGALVTPSFERDTKCSRRSSC